MKFKILGLAVLAISAACYLYSQTATRSIEPCAAANIEALATGEVIEGAVCFYKGNSVYEKRIPCEADYPNIGACGELIAGFYSNDHAQCHR